VYSKKGSLKAFFAGFPENARNNQEDTSGKTIEQLNGRYPDDFIR
jgi:hypothetical protein